MADIIAFKINTANRHVIFDATLRNTWRGRIQPIRQTLGFRESNDSYGARPKFVSQSVQHLDDAITEVSREKLPKNSFENLRRAWNEGKLLNTEINNLIKKYGKDIWGTPMGKRRLVVNPQSHLLAADEGETFYTTDLFYSNEDHRAYIKLQLEHMAYAKAMQYCRNHRSPKTVSKSKTLAKKIPPAKKAALTKRTTLAIRKTPNKTRRSLIAILPLRYTDLLMFPQDSKTQRHHVEHDRAFAPRNYGAVEESDAEVGNEYGIRNRGLEQQSQRTAGASRVSGEETPNEYELRSRSRNQPKIVEENAAQDHEIYAQKKRRWSRRVVKESDEEDNDDHANQHPYKQSRVEETVEKSQSPRSTQNTTRVVAKRTIDQIRNDINADRDSTLSVLLEGILEDTPEWVSIPQNQDRLTFGKNNPPKPPRKNQSVTGNEEEAIDPPEDESSEREKRTAPSELKLERLRLDLHVLLLGEVCDVPGAHSLSKDTDELWEASQEINLALKEIWTADKNKLQVELGAEKYRMVDRVINEWLVWRNMTRKLGSVTNVHPSKGPLPLLTGEQWAEKLGGKREFQEMDLRLATYRRFLRSSGSGANKEDFAELLATAFTSVINYSLGVETFISFYKEDILKFNERLFSWPLNFAPVR